MKSWLPVVTAAAVMAATPSSAQVAPGVSMPHINLKPSAKCYNPNLPQKAKLVEDRLARAEAAMQEYVRLAAAGSDLIPVFVERKKALVTVDGAQQPVQSFRDPWALRIARLERTGFAVSNFSNYHYHGTWRAVAADGSTLGYYDVEFQRPGSAKSSVMFFGLVSPTGPEPKARRYCHYSGDIENPALRP